MTLNPSVKVVLNGEEYHLLYGAAAFIEFKEHRGEDLLRFMQRLREQFGSARDDEGVPNPQFEIPVAEFRDVLWAGLIHEDEELTPKQVSNLFTLRDLPTLIPAVMEAFMLGLPEVTPEDSRPLKAPARARNRVKSIGAVSTESPSSNSASAPNGSAGLL